MLRHAVFLLLCTRALAETTFIDCTGKTVQDAFDTCLSKSISPASAKDCANYVKRAACINPSCCGNELYTSLVADYNATLVNTYKITNCNIPCASGTPPPADVLDCDSVATADIIYNKRVKELGYEGTLTQATGCKYYQNFASFIPKTCCSIKLYTDAMAYMSASLSILKIDGCQLVCGQSLSSAPSAPRAVFGMAVLSVVFGSVLAGY